MAWARSAVPTLAWRFLLSKVSDGFLSFIAWVSVVGVALGVLALVVVTSVINGFEGELVRTISGMNGDVILYSRGDPVMDPEKVEQKIRAAVPQTQAITPAFIMEMMVGGPNGVAGTVLEGIDLATVGKVTQVPERVKSGHLPSKEDEIALGTALAEKIGAKIGTEVRVIAPFAGEASQGAPGTPKVLTAVVTGLVNMGMHDYDSKFTYATLPAVQKFLEQPGRATAFKIRLKNGADSRRASDHLREAFGYPFQAKDWGQLNHNLLYAIKLEKVVISIILTVIVIVAAFNVVSTLMMMIHDKTREIAILKAMGFRASQSFRLFCLVGMGIGAVGTGVGVLLGLAINELIARTRLIDLPADIYYIGYLPVVVHWQEIALIGGLALLITFMATLSPAIQVSRRSPLEGIRYG